MRRRRIPSGLASAAILGLAAGCACVVQAQDEVHRWRSSTDGQRVMLFSTHDDATDDFDPLAFSCTVGSGVIDVEVRLRAEELARASKIIANDLYPVVRFSGTTPDTDIVLLDRISYRELGGWILSFSLDADHASLAPFEKTGAYRVRIGAYVDHRIALAAGLSDVARFRKQCLKVQPTPKR